MGTSVHTIRFGRKMEEMLGPVEESLEKNFFGPLAGPERSHEIGQPKTKLPWGPFMTLLMLTTLLLSVFIATIIWPIIDPFDRPAPLNYYPGADVVGLVVTLVLFGLLVWSFLAVTFTDPGRIPREWPWDPTKTDPRPAGDVEISNVTTPLASRIRGLERKLDGRTRFCKKCNLYKPDRAHHCKKLGRCVLEMDHWCPWVRNTIGYRNRKYFFLCVTYGWATLLSYCIVLGPYLQPAAKLSNGLDFFILFCWVLACIECGLLMALWSFHIYLTVHSFTTIEFREKHLAKESKIARSGEKVRDLHRQSVYDLGVWAGFKHLLGPYILLWLIPTRYGMPADKNAGVVYKVRDDHPLVRLAQGPKTLSSVKVSKPAQESDETTSLIAT